MSIPRVRMFAGPNGSGKSTLKASVSEQLLGKYINPDDIEKQITSTKALDFSDYSITVTETDVLNFFRNSTLLDGGNQKIFVDSLIFSENKLLFESVPTNSYFASVASDFIRQNLLLEKISFSFETVMSSEDKVQFLKKSQEMGFRTYLYFIATQDSSINVSRVQNRVSQGGHPVPLDKIVSRYNRSLDLLIEAIKYSYRAFIFDNSGQDAFCIAEIFQGTINPKVDAAPNWFDKYVVEKFEN